MPSYDSIAPFYDRIHGNRKSTIKFIKRLLKETYPNAKTLLSIGCGTGQICKALMRRYKITGTDISAEMLREAKKKLPKVEFYQQDLVQLSLPENYDIIVSLFGVLNHVLDFTDWKTFFQKVANHLNPGGIFVFDILSELCLYNLIINSPLIVKDGKLIVICDIAADEDGTTIWQTKGYQVEKNKQHLLFNTSVQQISFDVEKIAHALKEVFTTVSVMDLELGEVSERSELLYFVCQL